MKYIMILVIVISYSHSVDPCLDRAYKFATSKTKSDLDAERKEDLSYIFVDPTCCCTYNILSLFEDKTEDITGRVNPAMDTLTKALVHQLKASDEKIKELVHLKYTNALYSFFDKDGVKMKQKKLDLKPAGDGCQEPFKFRVLKKDDKKRKSIYREGILLEILSTLHHWRDIREIQIQDNMKGMVE